MDQKQLIKYALIAVAAYIVWKYLESQGGLAGLFGGTGQTALPPGTEAPGAPAGAPGETSGAGAGAGTGGSDTRGESRGTGSAMRPGSGTTSAPSTPSDGDLMAAAYDPAQAGKTGGYKLNFHQWNWYRMQAAIQATGSYEGEKHQPAWDGIVDPDTQVTAAEYQAQLAARGLSGLPGWSSGYSMGGYYPGRGVVQ